MSKPPISRSHATVNPAIEPAAVRAPRPVPQVPRLGLVVTALGVIGVLVAAVIWLVPPTLSPPASDLASIEVVTEPEGATLEIERNGAWVEIGQTPIVDYALEPEAMRFRVSLEGYYDQELSLPIPNQSMLIIFSTVLLASGATLYTFFCPSRVKEFSRDQWCDQLGRHLIHYWPLAWKWRYVRVVCALCYFFGGGAGRSGT